MDQVSVAPVRRIVFVDDEQHILDGLRNLLRKQRRQWDMAFALGGHAALEAFAVQPFDVIVSDMRMPGMDGAELLQEIKDHYPGTTRIVLSGHADRVAVQRALTVAHQFLSKPCDADSLRRVVERVCGLHAMLQDGALREVVGKLDKLPSVPQVYLDLVAALEIDDCTTATIAGIIERDPAMSVKVLQLVNSSYFGLGRRMSSIAEAVGYLGHDLLRSLALSVHVFARMEAAPVPGFALDRLQSSALVGGKLARSFFAGDKAKADEAFTAALVRDIGMMVLALGVPDRYAAILADEKASRQPLDQVEAQHLGVGHGAIGAYLLGVWGLPSTIVEAVAYHHRPCEVSHDDREVLAAVHLSGALADGAVGNCPARIDRHLFEGPLADKLTAWLGVANRELRKSGLDLPKVP